VTKGKKSLQPRRQLKPVMNESDILSMLSRASEFEQLKVREDEMDELDDLIHDCCEVPVRIICHLMVSKRSVKSVVACTINIMIVTDNHK